MKYKIFLHLNIVLMFLILPLGIFAQGDSDSGLSGNCEECEEWDDHEQRCIEREPTCWILAERKDDPQPSTCILSLCTPRGIPYSYYVPVKACVGREGYKTGHWTSKSIRMKLVPNRPQLSGDIFDVAEKILDCLLADPDAALFAAAMTAAQIYNALLVTGGNVPAALTYLGAETIAGVLVSICSCVSCDPCAYVFCEDAPGPPTYIFEKKYQLTGGDCS